MNNIEEKEADFHDEWADETNLSDVYVDEAFETFSAPENKQILNWMGNIEGKRILEVGCGLGEASVYFAKRGAQSTATDISPKMVQKAKDLAKVHGVQIDGCVVSANHLNNIPDNHFDYVYAGNLLHHVDIEKCVSQLKPKLKDGGVAFFWDPIAYNPVINVYRYMATKVRTEDEHPLKHKDIKTIRNIFSKVEVRYMWLTSLFVFLWFYLVQGIHPNDERYWKKILKDSESLSPFLSTAHKLDALLFKIFPPFRYFAWNIVIKAEK